ncbi:hypothetical protein FEM48_Zijuj06G0133300 [Ziziphus jujuba var. spinosa]|uniref:Uncharacterized protein n=1 Tax=Ziziphus jujuba var. spinosa TaxID=714518 RepID=A0A978V9I2_ZIZJJ|nr:hypothetical protein FEM48_Zijuj06G0133300 [Ziziphus jujuba var. spinosa]
MGCSRSASKKAKEFEGQMLQLEYFDDFKNDSRLNRRLRRKLNMLVANKNSKRKYNGNAPERRVKNKMEVEKIICSDGVKNKMQVKEIIPVDDVCYDDDENDSDYETCLMEDEQFCTDATTSVQEVGDDVGDSNEYNSDYVNYATYLMEGEKSCNDAPSVDEVGSDCHGCNSSFEECLKDWRGHGKSQTDARSVGDVYDDDDPDYKVFLKYLKKNRNSYVLHVFAGSEMLDPIMYENDYRPQDMFNLETGKTLKSGPVSGKTKVKTTLRGFSNRQNMRTKNSIKDRKSPRTLKKAVETSNRKVGKRRKGSVVKRKANAKCSGPVFSRMQGFSNIRSDSEATLFTKDDGKDNVESDGERSYLKFLNDRAIDDGEVVSVGQSGNPLKIDENEKSDSDLEVIAMDKDPNCNEGYTPFVFARPFHECMADEDWMSNGSFAACHSLFRDKLMEILKMPYDPKEYKNLMKEVSCRKPIMRDRILRGVTKSYKSDSIAESYLQRCTELAEKIDLARGDRLRTLNLLRGFFYWLKNLSQEGAFRPWLDPICSEVLPPLESPIDDNATTESNEDDKAPPLESPMDDNATTESDEDDNSTTESDEDDNATIESDEDDKATSESDE